jgi:hypothetical protein
VKVTRPKFGAAAFSALQQYAADCKQYVPKVMYSVVDVLPEDELAAAKALAAKQDIYLRVRALDS